MCFSVSKNPCLQLKHATTKNKKKIRKKNPASPVKKIQSPLKNKLLGSPVKNMPATSGSPQKLMDGFLKQEGAAAQVIGALTTAFSKATSIALDLVRVHKYSLFSLLDSLLDHYNACVSLVLPYLSV